MRTSLLKFTLSLFLLTSLYGCSDKEEGPKLVGRWDIVKQQPITYDLAGREYAYPVSTPTTEDYYVYSADGKYEVYYDKKLTQSGTYTRKDKTLLQTPANQSAEEHQITLITDTDLTLVRDARQLNSGIKAGVVYTTWFKKH